jgi:hypothetical protein
MDRLIEGPSTPCSLRHGTLSAGSHAFEPEESVREKMGQNELPFQAVIHPDPLILVTWVMTNGKVIAKPCKLALR